MQCCQAGWNKLFGTVQFKFSDTHFTALYCNKPYWAIIHYSVVNHVSIVKIQISFKVLSWSNFIIMSNQLWWFWGVRVWQGITLALTKCILRDGPAWRCLQMIQWADRPSDFPVGLATKVPPSKLSTFFFFFFFNHMAPREILSLSWRVIVLRQFNGEYFSGAPSGDFSELPRQTPQLGKKRKYMPSIAGPIRKNPVEDSGVAVLEIL